MTNTRRAAFVLIAILSGFSAGDPGRIQAQDAPTTELAGLVLQAGADAQAVSGAEVALAAIDGPAVYRASSDAEGRFRIIVGEPGRYRLSVARIGYEERAIEVLDLTRGRITRVTVELEPRPVALDSLVVRTERAAPPEFWERRERLADEGHFITPEYIEDTYPQLTLILRDAPGVYTEWAGWNTEIEFRNPGAGGGRCTPAIYLNGVALPQFPPLTQYVNVEDIVAIEVYRSNDFAPEGYRPAWGCGVVLVWARSEPRARSPLIPALLALGLSSLLGWLLF